MHVISLQYTIFSVFLTLIAAPVWSNPPQQTYAGLKAEQNLTADQLVSWVLEANPGLAAIQAAAEAAAHRVNPAGALDDPVLGYGIAPLTHDSNRGVNQRFDFSQKIPWPGTLAVREAAARNDALAVNSEAEMLQLLVITQTKAAYAEWHFIHEALNIHRATQNLLDELIVTTQARYATGLARKQDALQAEVELINLRNKELGLLRQQTTIQARINALLNRAPDASLPKAAPIEISRQQPPTLQELQTLAFTHHPDFSQLNAQISASKNRVNLAEKEFFPDFQVGMSYNSLWDDADKRPILGISINIPLDRSKRRSILNQARAETRRAEWLLVERRAELLADLAQARAEVIEAQASVALYQEKFVPLAEEYLESAIADYQSGAGGFLSVITAEQRKLSTKLEFARIRADFVRRLAELERWTGAPINPSLPQLQPE